MGVTQIEAEIQKWQAKVAELEEARKALLSRKAELEEERRRYLLSSVEGNGDAKARLQEIKRQLWDLAQEEEDAALALEGANAKLKQLEEARREAIRQQLLSRLAKKAKERLELARQIEDCADKLAEAVERYFKVSNEGYAICHQVAPGADGFWRTKDRLFGFLCYKLYQHFPVDLPAPLPVDRKSFTETEEQALKPYLKGGEN